MKRYRVTRYVHHDEPSNCLGRDAEPGEVFAKFIGPVYGAVDFDHGIALLEEATGLFFEFPRDAVEEVP